MRKININIDRPEISSAEIRERRDFENLLKRYKEVEKTPYYKRYRLAFFSGALLLVSAGTVLFLSMKEEKNNQLITETISSYSNSTNEASNSLVKQTVIKKEEESASMVNDKQEKHQSVIAIDPAADQTENQPIAEQQDTDLSTSSAAEIQMKISSLEEEIKSLKAQIEKLESEKPMKPVKATRKRFKVDVLPEEFPTLAKYKNILFEVAPDDKSFKDEYLNVSWESGKLKNDKDGGYLLSLSSKMENVTFKVQPVFEGNGYVAAMKDYKKYESVIDSLTKLENAKADEIQNLSSK